MTAPQTGPSALPAQPSSSIMRFFRSLSGRLLMLTVSFVMLAEIVTFLPSLAAFHRNWLAERVDYAAIALGSLGDTPADKLSESLQSDLLQLVGVRYVALRREDGSPPLELASMAGHGGEKLPVVDLRHHMPVPAMETAITTLFSRPGEMIRVINTPQHGPHGVVEVVVVQDQLRQDMLAFGERVFALSLIISLITGFLVFSALNLTFVRPMKAIVNHISEFRDRPNDASRVLRPSGRRDEIGRAEIALADMEHQVRTALGQQQRLAALGAAVARLSHDLRNSLATAQVISERLGASDDPKVRLVAPRLERAIARAGNLAEAAMRYGRADEAPPQLEPTPLASAVAEAAGDALAGFPDVMFNSGIGADLVVLVDREYLHRILVNLIRNGAQAMTAAREAAPQSGQLMKFAADAHLDCDNQCVRMSLQDNGPGLPTAALARLFEPFSAVQRADSSGLGLAIARELARAQGGDLTLTSSGPEGAVFDLAFACPPA